MTNHYDALGVAHTASPEVVKAAYRAQIRAVHPDLGGTEQQSQRINDAYRVLSDPAARAEYDRSLADEEKASNGPSEAPASEPRSTNRSSPESYTYSPRGGSEGHPSTPKTRARVRARGITAHAWVVTGSAIGTLIGLVSAMSVSASPAGSPYVLLAALASAFMCFLMRTRAVVIVSVGVLASCIILVRDGATLWPVPVAYVSALVLHVTNAHVRKLRNTRAAIDRAAQVWSRAERDPGCRVWFVEQISNAGTITTVLLRNIDTDEARTCELWGNIPQGAYVAVNIDTAMSTSTVLAPAAVASHTDMNHYLRKMRRGRRSGRRRTHT